MRGSLTTFAARTGSLALLSLVLGAASVCSAASITYYLDLTAGANSVTGDIVTDGTIGVLDAANIRDWNLLLAHGATTFDLLGPLSGSNSVLGGTGLEDFSATANQLLFNFSAPNFGTLFSASSVGGETLCFVAASSGGCIVGGDLSSLEIGVNNFDQFTSFSGTVAVGTTASTPEPSTFALLGAGIVLFGFRRLGNRRQQQAH